MTFAEAAMIMMSGKINNIVPLEVTKNNTYYVTQGVSGYNPVYVNVLPNIRSLTVTSNGTYSVPAGLDGYNPVIVNNPYETLYKIEHNMIEEIDTGFTDPDGNPIIIDGLPIGDGFEGANNLADIEFKDGEGNLSFTIADPDNNTVISVDIGVTKTDIYIPSLTVTNMKTGQSKTVSRDGLPSSWYMFNPDVYFRSGYFCFKTSYTPGAGIPYNIELAVSLSEIGIPYIDWSKAQWYISDPSSILN